MTEPKIRLKHGLLTPIFLLATRILYMHIEADFDYWSLNEVWPFYAFLRRFQPKVTSS